VVERNELLYGNYHLPSVCQIHAHVSSNIATNDTNTDIRDWKKYFLCQISMLTYQHGEPFFSAVTNIGMVPVANPAMLSWPTSHGQLYFACSRRNL